MTLPTPVQPPPFRSRSSSSSSSSPPPPKKRRLPSTSTSTLSWPLPVHITPSLAVPCLPMHPSDPADPAAALLARLARDGYLLFRALIPRHDVSSARDTIETDMRRNGLIVGSDEEREVGDLDGRLLIAPGKEREGCGPNLLARQDLANHPNVLAVLEHPNLRRLMTALLAPDLPPPPPPPTRRPRSNKPPPTPPISTHPYKWLRAVPTLLHTGPHRDATYFPSSKYPSLLTAWVPLGDLRPELGTLVCATPSAQAAADAADADAAIQLGADGTRSGWITDEERLRGMEWVTEQVGMGDVVVLGRERVHCSSVNMTNEWRLSCDTRWMRTDGEGEADTVAAGSSGEEDGENYSDSGSSESDDSHASSEPEPEVEPAAGHAIQLAPEP